MNNHNLIDKQNDFTSYSQYNLNQEQFKPINNLEQLSKCIKSSSNNVNKYSNFKEKLFFSFYALSFIGLTGAFFSALSIKLGKSPLDILILASLILGTLSTLFIKVIDMGTNLFSWRKILNQKILNFFPGIKESRLIAQFQIYQISEAVSNKDIEYSLILYLNNLIVSLQKADMNYALPSIEEDKNYLIECFSNNDYTSAEIHIIKKMEYWDFYERNVNFIIKKEKSITAKNEEKEKNISNYMRNIKKFSKDNKLVFLTKNDMNVVEETNPINLKSIL